MIVHAGCLALRLGGRWAGALVRGPSGAGKSDLALRALDAGFRLAADDRTLLFMSGGRLFGRAPDVLYGLIEARGLGIVGESPLPLSEIVLVADCRGPSEPPVERLPEADVRERILQAELPVLRLQALEPSAPAKLRRAMWALGAGR